MNKLIKKKKKFSKANKIFIIKINLFEVNSNNIWSKVKDWQHEIIEKF